jgi:hypothetical protein
MTTFTTFINRRDAALTGFRAATDDLAEALRAALTSNAVCQTRDIKGVIYVPTFQAAKVAAELVKRGWSVEA